MTFLIHTIDSAPPHAKENLRKIQEAKGFVPNVAGVFAGAPPVLEAFLKLNELMEKSTLTPEERAVIYMTVSHQNGSAYCMAAHTTEAEEGALDALTLDALHHGTPIRNQKLEALRQYTLGVLEHRGRPSDNAINTFLAAGYSPPQALEIVLGITLKTLTNYANRLAHPPIDDAFKGNGRPKIDYGHQLKHQPSQARV